MRTSTTIGPARPSGGEQGPETAGYRSYRPVGAPISAPGSRCSTGRFWPALVLACVLAFASQSLPRARPALSQGQITFSATSAENLFPTGITFQTEVRGGAFAIVAAALICQVEGDPGSARSVPLPIEPGRVLALRHTWDTRSPVVPPGAVIACQWEATDAAGYQAASTPARFTYEDTRFHWQTRRSDVAIIWSHDLPDVVASKALGLANQAVEYQHRIFQATLPRPIQIRLYNTHAELAAWQPALPAFSGGRAFPGQGITAQIALPGLAQADWLAAVIPHEISRLYFHQATSGARDAPAWLDEGLALYNEAGDHADEQRLLQAAVVRRDLLPLAGLAPALAGSDERQVRLAQAEALSAVKYLMYSDGPDRLASLLATYRAGLDGDAAFVKALRRSPAEFEDAWLMWIGVPAVWRAAAAPAGPAAAGGQAAAPATAEPGLAPATSPTAQPAAPPANGQPDTPPVALLVALILFALALPAMATRRRRS